MHVTSALSNGYLQPAYDARRAAEVLDKSRPTPITLAALEQQAQILDKEQGLRNAYGPEAKVSTTYRYSVGQDGHRYISGAYVSIEAERPNEARETAGQPGQAQAQEARDEEGRGLPGMAGRDDNELSPEEEAAVRELQRIEQEVIAHEAAHQAAGGGLAGAVSYSYTRGPDGRNYITGGEVPIQMPVSDNPEQTLRDMAQVQRAAMAPASPSAADVQIAAKASAKAASARAELAARNRDTDNDDNPSQFSAGISSVRAGMMFEDLHGEYREHEHHHHHDDDHHADGLDPAGAYSRSASSRGLWTVSRGFENTPQMAGQISGLEHRFNVAA